MIEIFEKSEPMKERFRSVANKLLNRCFLVKKNEDSKKDYVFVRENKNDFEEYFDLLGYDVLIDENLGVIALKNRYGTGRLNLTKLQSVLLLIIRLLYLEKRRDLSTFSEDVIVSMGEILDKFKEIDLNGKSALTKSEENEFITLFKRFNLLKNLDSDVNYADCRIMIFPSIMLAIQTEDINVAYEKTQMKLDEYSSTQNEDTNSDDAESEN